MNTVYTVRDFIECIFAFESPIAVNGSASDDYWNRAMALDPRIGYYITSLTWNQRGAQTVYNFVYKNKDFNHTDIKFVDDYNAAKDELLIGVGRFEKKLVLIARFAFDFNKLYKDFMTTYAAFYSNLVSVSYERGSFSSFSFVILEYEFKYRLGSVILKTMKIELEKKVAEVSEKLFIKEMSSEVKAYVAHNYLARTVDYWKVENVNPVEMSYMQSAYGALINKRCVCQGFAEAYKRLLDAAGIECCVVCGNVKGYDASHAWNLVSFDGKNYFHVDVTWDSRPTEDISDEYFCLSDAQMKADRTWTARPNWICRGLRNVRAEVKNTISVKKNIYIARGIDRAFLEVKL